MQAHCPKCKVMRDIANAQTIKAANGKPLTKGTCAVCGSTLMRIGDAPAAPVSPASAAGKLVAAPIPPTPTKSVAASDPPAPVARQAIPLPFDEPDLDLDTFRESIPLPFDDSDDFQQPSQPSLPSPARAAQPPNHPTTQPPNHLTTQPPNHPTTQPPNNPTTQSKRAPAATRAKKSAAPKRATRSRRTGSRETEDDGGETLSPAQIRESYGPARGALVIVESPAKAKTISKFLGSNYRVRASVGHIRDLPLKDMGVDIEHDFKPKYEITAKKHDVVKELREYAQGAQEIYLATDPDREGEAISWHLASVLKSQIAGKPVHRVEFHEITQDAIRDAFSHPRTLDMGRVDAQQARRVLDRIVGYTISPLLAKKLKKWTASAGRVQSVAVRLVVEREREIMNFVAVEYWTIEAELAKRVTPRTNLDIFRARLVQVGKDDFECHSGPAAEQLKSILEKCDYQVTEVRRKDVTRNPYPPYITSTLQQDASRRLGFNPKRTMKVAQELYDGLKIGEEGEVGLITYMRTDSTNIAPPAQKEALEYIEQKFGEKYLPSKPRVYTKKVAGAQEAHEAIRPTKTFREPNAIRQYLDNDQYKLYDLIWKRFVASQMASAIFDTTAVDISATIAPTHPIVQNYKFIAPITASTQPPPELILNLQHPNSNIQALTTQPPNHPTTKSPISNLQSPSANSSVVRPPSTVAPFVTAPPTSFLFRANGSILKFAGYLAVYGRSVGDADEEDDADKRLPPLTVNELLDLLGIYPEQHFTEPPPRYTEATLIKALEQHGIGRPSTYAPIMANIQDRDYIEQIENRRLKPTELGFVVNDLLVAHFAEILDLGFTAQMEEKLDAVELGKQDWVALMHEFYGPFKESVDRAAENMPITRVADQETDVKCDLCGSPMVVKKGKFGKFLSCSTFPACKGMKKMTTGVTCPKCKQGDVRELKSKKGRIFYGCSRYPQCDFVSWDKPLTEPCPTCGGMLVHSGKNVIRCVNGDYTRDAKPESKAPA